MDINFKLLCFTFYPLFHFGRYSPDLLDWDIELGWFGKLNFHNSIQSHFRESVNKKICDSSIIHFIDKLDLSVKAILCDHIPLFLCGGTFAQPIFESVIEFVHCDFGKCCAHVMRPS